MATGNWATRPTLAEDVSRRTVDAAIGAAREMLVAVTVS
jgi:hypothetical protein